MPVPVRTGSELTPRRCRRAELRRELTEVYKSVDNLRKELKEVRRENSTLRRASGVAPRSLAPGSQPTTLPATPSAVSTTMVPTTAPQPTGMQARSSGGLAAAAVGSYVTGVPAMAPPPLQSSTLALRQHHTSGQVPSSSSSSAPHLPAAAAMLHQSLASMRASRSNGAQASLVSPAPSQYASHEARAASATAAASVAVQHRLERARRDRERRTRQGARAAPSSATPSRHALTMADLAGPAPRVQQSFRRSSPPPRRR